MDQPDFGDGRDYAPGHVEVFEERTGAIIGRYDPQTQPISVLIGLVHQAVEERRRPDWMPVQTALIMRGYDPGPIDGRLGEE